MSTHSNGNTSRDVTTISKLRLTAGTAARQPWRGDAETFHVLKGLRTMRVNSWAAILAALTASCVTPSFAATQTPQAWTTNVVAGEYPSQQAALGAVRAQGGAYALVENVEKVLQTLTATTFVYGATSRGPEIGAWNKFTFQGCNTNPKSTEAEAMACVESDLGSQPTCPAATAVPLTSWQASYNFSDGTAYIETRMNRATYYSTSNCVASTIDLQAWRERVVACPAGLTWNSTDQACSRHDIARISTRPMPCSDCDLQHNPVNVSTGDKYQSETDFSLSWLSFSRHYHSAYSVPGAMLGHGWSHDLNIRLYLNGSSGAGVVLSNGDILPFRYSVGEYEAIDGSGWRIKVVAGVYELWKPTQTLKFDSLGRVVRIDDLSGNVLTPQYDANGRLATVTHSSGRSILFEYETVPFPVNARLIAIKADGTALVNYEYDSGGRLEWVRYPNATARRYHYENPVYPNHLTGITDETNQRYSTYGYSVDGLATLSEHAGGLFRGTFEYQPDGTTLYVDPNGRSQSFQFTGDGDYHKVNAISDTSGVQSITYALQTADFRRRPTSRVDKRNVTTTYSYSDVYDAGFATNVRLTTTNQAVGTPQARTTQERRHLAHGWLLKRLVSNSEMVYLRNTRGQVLSITERDVATNTSRLTTTAYCEQADVTAGVCPLLGLVKSVDGPRTDVSDLVSSPGS